MCRPYLSEFSCTSGNNFRKLHRNFQLRQEAQNENYSGRTHDFGDVFFCIEIKYLIMQLFEAPYLSVQLSPVSMSVFIISKKHSERTELGQAAIREILPFGWQYI